MTEGQAWPTRRWVSKLLLSLPAGSPSTGHRKASAETEAGPAVRRTRDQSSPTRYRGPDCARRLVLLGLWTGSGVSASCAACPSAILAYKAADLQDFQRRRPESNRCRRLCSAAQHGSSEVEEPRFQSSQFCRVRFDAAGTRDFGDPFGDPAPAGLGAAACASDRVSSDRGDRLDCRPSWTCMSCRSMGRRGGQKIVRRAAAGLLQTTEMSPKRSSTPGRVKNQSGRRRDARFPRDAGRVTRSLEMPVR
jgi:hypothetical protein